MSVAEHTKTAIRLETACISPVCSRLAFPLHKKLNTDNYTLGVSLMRMPSSLEEWRYGHRTARKRADRAQRLGYRFAEIDRSQFNDDIYDINTSKRHRQGRPMSEGYRNRVEHAALPPYPCNRHRIHTYGVLEDTSLRAYLSLYRVGELGLVSMILGHGVHLENDIMYLLAAGMIADQARHGGYLYYNRHDSGTDGLRYYKERIGFAETDIEWVL